LGPSNSPIFLDQEAFSADARPPIRSLQVDLSSYFVLKNPDSQSPLTRPE
jgi:hypothetical protein